ncbi:MAG: hypothetical protein CK528_04830 [Alcaligenaceae bacterium]|nr:MAG: hypothetical protein CK528_04830 [Alcaligenaceae bacterium]
MARNGKTFTQRPIRESENAASARKKSFYAKTENILITWKQRVLVLVIKAIPSGIRVWDQSK